VPCWTRWAGCPASSHETPALTRRRSPHRHRVLPAPPLGSRSAPGRMPVTGRPERPGCCGLRTRSRSIPACLLRSVHDADADADHPASRPTEAGLKHLRVAYAPDSPAVPVTAARTECAVRQCWTPSPPGARIRQGGRFLIWSNLAVTLCSSSIGGRGYRRGQQVAVAAGTPPHQQLKLMKSGSIIKFSCYPVACQLTSRGGRPRFTTRPVRGPRPLPDPVPAGRA
jgi:hypothetical protein